MTMKKERRPKTAYRDGFGILNPYGDFWTSDIFETVDKAREHVRQFWLGCNPAQDIGRYKIVRARQRTGLTPAAKDTP